MAINSQSARRRSRSSDSSRAKPKDSRISKRDDANEEQVVWIPSTQMSCLLRWTNGAALLGIFYRVIQNVNIIDFNAFIICLFLSCLTFKQYEAANKKDNNIN